VSLIIMNW